jgi:hypothetical protein
MDERGGRRRLTGDGDERRMGGCDVLVERLTEVSL